MLALGQQAQRTRLQGGRAAPRTRAPRATYGALRVAHTSITPSASTSGALAAPASAFLPLPALAAGALSALAVAGVGMGVPPGSRAMPRLSRTLFSISNASAGLSRRNSRALSRPWPIFSPL